MTTTVTLSIIKNLLKIIKEKNLPFLLHIQVLSTTTAKSTNKIIYIVHISHCHNKEQSCLIFPCLTLQVSNPCLRVLSLRGLGSIVVH